MGHNPKVERTIGWRASRIAGTRFASSAAVLVASVVCLGACGTSHPNSQGNSNVTASDDAACTQIDDFANSNTSVYGLSSSALRPLLNQIVTTARNATDSDLMLLDQRLANDYQSAQIGQYGDWQAVLDDLTALTARCEKIGIGPKSAPSP